MMTSDEQGKVIDDSGEVVGFFVSSIVAKRAVACMTALAHVTDKQMESGELLHMGQAIKDLTKQRAELLTALEELNSVSANGFLYDDPARVKARKAIASVKGNQPQKTCTYPKCNCPFDAPADPNWCARGYPKMGIES